MKRIFLLLLLLFAQQNLVYSQKEGYIGIFGEGVGLDFNPTPPEVFLPQYQAGENFDSDEGSAAISDKNGNLLFYTNGTTVWNQQHRIMSNGTKIYSKGTTHSTTQVLIVPIPKNPHLNYIFSIGSQGGSLSYSLVNMQLENGLGRVTEKDKVLYPFASEKLSIVPHASGDKLWLITHQHNSDAFRVFLIDENGINIQYIESKTGEIHHANVEYQEQFIYENTNAIGYLKASPNGRLLAAAILGTKGLMEIFDFDPETGLVSNGRTIFQDPEKGSYGVAFSPDGSKLYQSCPYSNEIFQYDMEAGSTESIKTSALLITTEGLAALQLGPDGLIYSIGTGAFEYLDVIQNPNARGTAANYVKNAVYLQGRKARLGLPEFNQHVIPPEIIISSFCAGEGTYFKLAETENVAEVHWDFGNEEVTEPENLANGFTATHIYQNAGTYTVSARVKYRNGNRVTFTKKVEIFSLSVDLGPDLLVCQGQDINLVPSVSFENANYKWSNGSTSPTLWVDAPGKYWVEATNFYCSASDTIIVDFMEAPYFELKDTIFCQEEGFKVELNDKDNVVYHWNDSFTGGNRIIKKAGVYLVRGENKCGSWTQEFNLKMIPKLHLELPEEVLLCKGETYIPDLTAAASVSYRWQDGLTTPDRGITIPGTYSVEVFNACEYLTASVRVHSPIAGDFSFPNVITPNGDEWNEFFVIDPQLLGSVLRILNRWGKEVYYSPNYQNNWNAKGLTDGVYYFLLEESCSRTTAKGFIQVLRQKPGTP